MFISTQIEIKLAVLQFSAEMWKEMYFYSTKKFDGGNILKKITSFSKNIEKQNFSVTLSAMCCNI